MPALLQTSPELSAWEKDRVERLLAEATKWVGTVEIGGDNKGPQVEAFQKVVDNKAQGEAWCMAFVQWCLEQSGGSDIFKSEHCLTVWSKSPEILRRAQPIPGCVAIWRTRGTLNGHAGIVKSVQGMLMNTIEGNTGPGADVERNGDGVYLKSRSAYRSEKARMELVGFLWPWLNEKKEET